MMQTFVGVVLHWVRRFGLYRTRASNAHLTILNTHTHHFLKGLAASRPSGTEDNPPVPTGVAVWSVCVYMCVCLYELVCTANPFFLSVSPSFFLCRLGLQRTQCVAEHRTSTSVQKSVCVYMCSQG